jgi:hypothetical protein
VDGLDGTSGLGFDIAAALLRDYERDELSLLEVVATKLEGVLGERVTVHRRRFVGRRRVSDLAIALGEERFRLRQVHAGLDAVIEHVVGGVRLRSDRVHVREWITRLSSALTAAVSEGSAAQDALQRFIL